MGSIQRLIHPISSENALEVLATSMWSTMVVTGFLFMSCLSVYLSVKVKNSVKSETIDVGPMDLSFIFSVSGIRYFANHIRHHLFETPLLPRRRFSSMSVFWIPRILKRLSFSSRHPNFSYIEPEISNFDKTRRNSTHSDRRNSTSKSKRQSVPQILPSASASRNISNIVLVPNESKVNHQSSSARNAFPTRRSTLPVLSIPSTLTDQKDTSQLTCTLTQPSNLEFLSNTEQVQVSRISLDSIMEEEIIESTVTESLIKEVKEKFVEEVVDAVEGQSELIFGSSSDFGDIISDASETPVSESVLEEVEAEAEVQVEMIDEPKDRMSKSIDIKQKPESQLKFDSSSPKNHTYLSSYFNYLPESIFGYSKTASTKATESQAASEISSTPPPGFSKRSASHDYSSSPLQTQHQPDLNNEFNDHQPLYARRRTETFKKLTESAKAYNAFNAPSFNFQPFESKSEENLSKQPNRSNSSSPCLVDLQNTDDLFAPINWSYSNADQTESLRKSWDTIIEGDEEVTADSVASPKPIGSEVRKKSSSYSFFGGY